MAKTYVVQSGDTLSGIVARECPGVPWQQIAQDNNIQNPSLIYPGQALVLNCVPENGHRPQQPAVYVVRSGDTLAAIVNHFCPGKSYMDVAAENNIPDPDQIFVGQQITLNCGEQPPPPPPVSSGVHRANDGTVWLDVPFYSQNDPVNANLSGTDCGPACVRMMIGWHRLFQQQADPQAPTINEIWNFVGKLPGQFTNLTDQVNAARNWRLGLQIVNGGATLSTIKNQIDNGKPVLMLCHYGSFGNSAVAFTGGHFVVVVGFAPGVIIVNDPIGWFGAKGWRIPEAVFERGIGIDTALDGNPAHAGLFVN